MTKAHKATVTEPNGPYEKVGDTYIMCGHCIGDGENMKGVTFEVVYVEEGTECDVCGVVLDPLK